MMKLIHIQNQTIKGYNMNTELHLVDILFGLIKNNFENNYPTKRRKLRFNISWQDEVQEHGKKINTNMHLMKNQITRQDGHI